MPYAKALKKAVQALRRPSANDTNERLTRRVMFRTMAGGENPAPGRPEKNRTQCPTEGSTESSPLLFRVETVFWPRAAETCAKVVRWNRRSDGLRHREVAPGPVGMELATPRS